jgi:hypothetical protein
LENRNITGFVDSWNVGGYVSGWAFSEDFKDIEIDIILNGESIGRSVANIYRSDFSSIRQGRVGFSVQCSSVLEPGIFVDGRIEVKALCLSDPPRKVEIWEELQSFVRFAAGLEAGASPTLSIERLAWARSWIGQTGIQLSAPALLSLLAGLALIEQPVRCEEVSLVGVSVGLNSPDGEASVGRDGHLFLLRGSNDLVGQYDATEDARRSADLWLDVFDQRANLCAGCGVAFAQMVLPEKLNVLDTLSPMGALGATPILKALQAVVSVRPYWLSTDEVLQGQGATFAKTDTHLSPFGAWAVFSRIAAWLSLDVAGWRSDHQAVFQGDLGVKFSGAGLFESLPMPEIEGCEPTLLEQEDDFVGGAHSAIRRVWTNPRGAPLSVLVVGNSFFGSGDRPMDLTWWLARSVERTSFVWSAELDPEFLERYRPDVVICQTVERFMNRIPRA